VDTNQIVFVNRAIRHSERRHNALCFFQLALLAEETAEEDRSGEACLAGEGARPTLGSFALSSGEARAALEPSSFEKSAWTKLRHLTCGASRRISQHLITARKLIQQCFAMATLRASTKMISLLDGAEFNGQTFSDAQAQSLI